MKTTHNFTKTITKFGFGLAALAFAALPFIGGDRAQALVDTPWGPDRDTFTWADPAPYATFNSITDNPTLGDERNFVRIGEVPSDGSQVQYGDEVTLEMGKTYEVYIYYHNNADAHEVGKTAIGIADGAAVKSSFPATLKSGERGTVTGTVFASDTQPLAVWDGAYMTATQDLYLRYVPGTAIIHNGGALNGQNIGPDHLFGDGALLGYNKFSGILPGCNEYAGYVTYRIFADAPDFTIKKSVVGDSLTVKAGDEVTFKIRYENIGTMDQLNVVMQDILPSGLEYIAGSATLYNNNFTEGKAVNDDLVTDHGMSIGDYAGGSGWAELTYKALVSDSVKCGDQLTNAATISTTDGNKHDSVTLTVTDDNCDLVPAEDCTTNPTAPECAICATNPNAPECSPCTANPNAPGCDREELPDSIVETGPLEIVMAVLVVLGICGGAFYLYRTRRTLKTVEGDITNAPKEEQKPEEPKEEPKDVKE